MEIARDKYIHDLILRKENGMIKVITGIRRVGKSYLLFELFYRYLLKDGVDESHIIRLAFDAYPNERYCNPETFVSFIDSKVDTNGTYYLLLDEVQMLGKFEDVLNGLLYRKKSGYLCDRQQFTVSDEGCDYRVQRSR